MAEERPKEKAEKGTCEKASLKRSKHRPIEDIDQADRGCPDFHALRVRVLD